MTPLPAASEIAETVGSEPWERWNPRPTRESRATAATLRRQVRRLERQKASRNRQRTSYGGSNWPRFKAEIRKRDGNTCVWCQSVTCKPVQVHHVRERVQMGGRKKVSVNRPENAACLGPKCHDLADLYRISPRQLEAVLSDRYGYVYENQEEDAA